jgi:hypothetical protein
LAPMDWRRLFAVSTFGALYMGGAFYFLRQIFPQVVCAVGRQMPSRFALARQLENTNSAAHAFGCAIADNIHDGTLMIPLYFLSVGMLQGDGLEKTLQNLKNEWLTSYQVGAGFWIPVVSANFALVPARYRVRTMAAANMAWTVIIDYLAHRNTNKPREGEKMKKA